MFRTLTRLLAVCLLALSPLWGVGSAAARPSLFPYWPSFDAVGCNAVTSSAGIVTIACATGGYVTTQISSAYGGCSQLNIDVQSFSGSDFIVIGTPPVSSEPTTQVVIDGTGTYFMQFQWVPATTVGPIALQFSMPSGNGSMSISSAVVNPCPIQPTATNTLTPSNTPTPNPSDTATNTITPGPSHTPTAIPTNTPLPSGHSTFTATATVTPRATATPTATAGPSFDNCGSPDYPILNCTLLGGPGTIDSAATDWSIGDTAYQPFCYAAGQSGGAPFPTMRINSTITGSAMTACSQTVTPGKSGTLLVRYQYQSVAGSVVELFGGGTTINGGSGCTVGGSTYCVSSLGTVTAGVPDFFAIQEGPQGCCAGSTHLSEWVFDNFWVGISGSTPTPAPGVTATTTPTVPASTATAQAQMTLTAIASSFTPTPIPIPGAQETLIPTDTPCPGGCAVGQLTQVPGFATRVLVDTSPFSALEHLSLARSSCQPFGYVQIPVPVIHGTPALGSTTPLSFTWTAPVTHTWDDTNVFSNTALQPCAMVNEIPSFVWDFTYWLSVLMCAVGWFMWLIGFVGRLSGDETING